MTTKPVEAYQARCNAVERDRRRVTVNAAWLEMVCKQADVPYPSDRLLPGSACPSHEEIVAHLANWAALRENDLANAIPAP